jgi:protein TonB
VFSLPGTALGTRVELAYLPGRAPVPVVHPKAKAKPQAVSAPQVAPAPSLVALSPTPAASPLPPLPHLTVTETAPSPNASAPAAAVPDASSGSDSWGSGSIQIALTTFSPSPAPDLSALPHGIQGDVVVDVTIDPSGKVADLAVLHTLGYGIESSVIGTLKTWVFRPATKDGTPIASVQELHFHFGPV